ncbi:MAG: hypothetical protein JW809_15330 [Pirellulales bacterium]|nr:hypothetical protein [Pirellulales bacterium]
MTPPTRRPWRPQFGIKTLLAATAALAVLLGALRWMEATPGEMAIVLGVVVLSAAAAVGLVLALAAAVDDDNDSGSRPSA